MRAIFVDQVDPSGVSDEVISRVANLEYLKSFQDSSILGYRPELMWRTFTEKLKKFFIGVVALALVLIATHQVTASAFAL